MFKENSCDHSWKGVFTLSASERVGVRAMHDKISKTCIISLYLFIGNLELCLMARFEFRVFIL